MAYVTSLAAAVIRPTFGQQPPATPVVAAPWRACAGRLRLLGLIGGRAGSVHIRRCSRVLRDWRGPKEKPRHVSMQGLELVVIKRGNYPGRNVANSVSKHKKTAT